MKYWYNLISILRILQDEFDKLMVVSNWHVDCWCQSKYYEKYCADFEQVWMISIIKVEKMKLYTDKSLTFLHCLQFFFIFQHETTEKGNILFKQNWKKRSFKGENTLRICLLIVKITWTYLLFIKYYSISQVITLGYNIEISE